MVCAVLAIGLLLSGASQPQRPASSAAGTGVIIGRVVDADSAAPLSGILVLASSGASEPAAIVTDAQGAFVFRRLRPGTYSLTARIGGHGYSPSGFLVSGMGHQIGAYLDGGYGQRRPAGPMQTIEIGEGQRVENAVVRLWRGAAITGRVVDEAGEPLVGVVVSAVQRASDGQLLNGPTARTDDRGLYRIGTLVPASYVVVVPQTQVLVPDFVVQADGSAPEFTPQPPGVRIGDSRLIAPPAQMTTNTALPVTREGRRFVYQTTFHPGATDVRQARVIQLRSGEERPDADVQLQPAPASTIEGTLMSPTGPASGFNVSLSPLESAGTSPIEVSTTASDSSGHFSFPLVPAGVYTIRAVPTASSQITGYALDEVVVGDTPRETVTLAVRPPLTMRIRLVFEGVSEPPSPDRLKNPPIAIKRVIPLSRTNSAQLIAKAASDGRYVVEGVQPGEYVFVARDLSTWTAQSFTIGQVEVSDAAFTVGAGDPPEAVVTFTDKPASIAGRVDGSPAGTSVLLFPADRERWRTSRASARSYRIVRASDDGSYRLTGLLPGEYLLAAIRDELASDWPDARLLEKIATQAIAVRIPAGQTQSAIVRTVTLK